MSGAPAIQFGDEIGGPLGVIPERVWLAFAVFALAALLAWVVVRINAGLLRRAGVPETIEGLHDHLQDLAGDVGEASDLAEALVTYAAPKVQPLLWAIAGQAGRAERRLNEATDALHGGHTENVGHRLEDVSTMALHLNHALSFAWETAEQGESSDMKAGAFAVASNAADYASTRLDFLVYEAHLPID